MSVGWLVGGVWPDLAKFRQFGTTLKHFGHFDRVHSMFGKNFSLFWQILHVIG